MVMSLVMEGRSAMQETACTSHGRRLFGSCGLGRLGASLAHGQQGRTGVLCGGLLSTSVIRLRSRSVTQLTIVWTAAPCASQACGAPPHQRDAAGVRGSSPPT
jgi:hypothetical protein